MTRLISVHSIVIPDLEDNCWLTVEHYVMSLPCVIFYCILTHILAAAMPILHAAADLYTGN